MVNTNCEVPRNVLSSVNWVHFNNGFQRIISTETTAPKLLLGLYYLLATLFGLTSGGSVGILKFRFRFLSVRRSDKQQLKRRRGERMDC